MISLEKIAIAASTNGFGRVYTLKNRPWRFIIITQEIPGQGAFGHRLRNGELFIERFAPKEESQLTLQIFHGTDLVWGFFFWGGGGQEAGGGR